VPIIFLFILHLTKCDVAFVICAVLLLHSATDLVSILSPIGDKVPHTGARVVTCRKPICKLFVTVTPNR